MKKILSFALALALCLGLTVPAFAVDASNGTFGSFTITGPDYTISFDAARLNKVELSTIYGADGFYEDPADEPKPVPMKFTLVELRAGSSIKITGGESYDSDWGSYPANTPFLLCIVGGVTYDGSYSTTGQCSGELFAGSVDTLFGEGWWGSYEPRNTADPDGDSYVIVKASDEYASLYKTQSKTASPTNDKLTVDGVLSNPTVYKIDDSNYFKIRDVAALLDGTSKQVSVGYDSVTKSVTLTTGQGYTKLDTDLAGAPTGNQTAESSSDVIYINGEKAELTVYKIDGGNYFKLRDLGKALNFYVGWEKDTGMYIETDKPYSE